MLKKKRIKKKKKKAVVSLCSADRVRPCGTHRALWSHVMLMWCVVFTLIAGPFLC